MIWVCVWETRVGTTTADVCLLKLSLPSILCYITCIHSHTCLHVDSSPFWDTRTSPLGLLLVWTFVLSIRRYWAGLAGDISGWGWYEQKLVIDSGQEQLPSTQWSSRSSGRRSYSSSWVTVLYWVMYWWERYAQVLKARKAASLVYEYSKKEFENP